MPRRPGYELGGRLGGLLFGVPRDALGSKRRARSVDVFVVIANETQYACFKGPTRKPTSFDSCLVVLDEPLPSPLVLRMHERVANIGYDVSRILSAKRFLRGKKLRKRRRNRPRIPAHANKSLMTSAALSRFSNASGVKTGFLLHEYAPRK